MRYLKIQYQKNSKSKNVMETNEKAQLTKLISNNAISKIERLRINSICRFTNRMRGEHTSGRGGTSIEFSDYRNYSPGDDLRFIDWNIYARLNKPYMKLFKLEEEMHLVIIIDASNSMLFEGKLELAKSIAASYGLMGLYGNERVSLYVLNDDQGGKPAKLSPMAGRGNMRKLFHFLEKTSGGGTKTIDEGIDNILKFHKGKGVALLLSDFMTFGNLRRTMNSLFNTGLEICALQILAPSELSPELYSDSRFIDSETSNKLDITSGSDILEIYHEHKNRFIRELEELVRNRSGRFLSISSESKLNYIIFEQLLKEGCIK